MLVAMFADLHANRQAFAACLTLARRRGADRMICLGDYVGYGADPEWTVDAVMELVSEGALAVRGNHDDAIGNARETMSVEAQASIEWTRGRLGVTQRQFLSQLPLTLTQENRLYVHADASSPGSWRYVRSSADAARSLRATAADVTLCGHVHSPAIYSLSAVGKLTAFVPMTDVAVQFLPGRHWLAVLGSVGQPRDGNPAASFAMLDTERQQITYCRAPYDVEAAAARIRENRLPTWLADRLLVGR